VLTAGALQKRKGQDMMLRALPAIRAVCPDVLYCMIGQPLERPYLERLIDEVGVRDHVQFRGAPSDSELIDCYQQCDVFALPSRQVGWDLEGFGIVALEAQACGKPVVVGRSGGAPETVEAGRTGEVVDCERPEPLAEAIIGLLQNPSRREAMAARARPWVVERFDWQVLGRQASAMFSTHARHDEIVRIKVPS
jgi:phosphatidylinositol alpha-1,6-mannosyltransferase